MNARTKRLALGIYLVLLHLVLAVMIFETDFLDRAARKLTKWRGEPTYATEDFSEWHQRSVLLHTRSLGSVPEGSVLFFGDSLTQGLCVSAVSPNGVNFGIASDTTAGLRERIGKYREASERASCVVLAIGINDSAYRSIDEAMSNYSAILANLPDDVSVVVSSLLPVDDTADKVTVARVQWVADFNQRLATMAEKMPAITYVDCVPALDTDGDGRLDGHNHVGDGIHLSTAGNLAWASVLKTAIAD